MLFYKLYIFFSKKFLFDHFCLYRYRSKNRKLNVRANSNQTETKSEKNNKIFNKQNNDLTTYHSAKAHDRDSEYIIMNIYISYDNVLKISFSQ